MNGNLQKRVLAFFQLPLDGEDDQKKAVLERDRNIVVTAGAGSGKTRTLVARFISLLIDGYDIRRIVAITFTEKAAREMRSRIRETFEKLLANSSSDDGRELLSEWNARMDAARISTIHSLCTEILRSHPAEAGIDPKFEVLDEGLTAALRAQCVRDVMSEMADKEEFGPVFNVFDTISLASLLTYLLEHRLQVNEAFDRIIDYENTVQEELLNLVEHPEITEKIKILSQAGLSELKEDAGDKLSEQVQNFLVLWNQAEEGLASNEFIAFCSSEYQARHNCMNLSIGKRSGSYYKDEIFRPLRDSMDEILAPIFGDKEENQPSVETEIVFQEIVPLIKSTFRMLEETYEKELQQLSALDFDDLEGRAAALLKQLDIQSIWQSKFDALLVDEFQDTNQRQRDIVEALTGKPGQLFIVGDAKQSIYRFRQADVTVFRSIREDINEKGGLPIILHKTFRAHKDLLDGMNDLLRDVMGDHEDPTRLYFEPFSEMVADRSESQDHFLAPHVEFVLGGGEKSDEGRTNAARALACRLLELKQQGQIQDWDDVVLLFRSANGFGSYEDAFEEANIPFVTIAGKGFYDRPEIRDLLNILRALTDPMDDAAMAGLLRSPAFGLSDASLYQLRQGMDGPEHFWAALNSSLEFMGDADKLLAERTSTILNQLLLLVDRVPVTELLKKLVDLTDYRAIMAIENQSGGGARLWRNLDKLSDDARASGKINVRDFLEYLDTINSTGVREGEAPAQAQDSVRLMTIHKAKGLQFPIVVLADASRLPRSAGEIAYVHPKLGLSFKLDPEPLVYRLAQLEDKRQSKAEEQRILYVALTRAQEKIIINGYVTKSKKEVWQAKGWLDDLCQVTDIDINRIIDQAGQPVISQTSNGYKVRGWSPLLNAEIMKGESTQITSDEPAPQLKDIYEPLVIQIPTELSETAWQNKLDWLFKGGGDSIPGIVLGKMVHKAVELWLFPENPNLKPLLKKIAINEGISEKTLRDRTVSKAIALLERLKSHPVFTEIDTAAERFHELPYSELINGFPQTGYMDLLYKLGDKWKLIDFKTDAIFSEVQKNQLRQEYSIQANRYRDALHSQIGINPNVRICFLDDQGKVVLYEIC